MKVIGAWGRADDFHFGSVLIVARAVFDNELTKLYTRRYSRGSHSHVKVIGSSAKIRWPSFFVLWDTYRWFLDRAVPSRK